MKRVTVSAVDTVEVVSAVAPPLRPDEARVRTIVVGICGSDVHACHGRHPFVPLPYNPGHEVVGEVIEVGRHDLDIRVGDRVIVEPTLPCWDCKMCRTGRSNICEKLQFFGCGYEQGGLAEEFTVPTNRLHRVADEIADLDAVLIEPLATPVHAVRLAGDVRDKAVAIIGSGTIGLLTLKALRHAGARRVVMTDVLAQKRDVALAFGADVVIDGARPDAADAVRTALGESADAVFDCVAVQATVDQATAMASKGGTVIIVGVAAKPVSVPLPQIQDLQLRLQGAATYLSEDYDVAVEIIRSGAVSAAEFVTSRFEFDDAADAFAAAARGTEVKVIVTT
ncbi:2-desacetyl-2-hydroxyethyl bacteriochlorophyllide A dehydrogenase [Propionibacteriaceae bacterium ES.041]|nr:alcohol dehydrogenase [Enemella evansiae]PFG67145.1 2-desacetyl-2-hydroxyethyl bacteriochlorophyllide A dehydrogenase [Propionibacteriaceae bacterium ES.041]